MKIEDIFLLFADEQPISYEVKNTSHGESDFREIVIARWEEGVLSPKGKNRMVIKLAHNGFTDAEHLLMWERLSAEYRKRGFCCPEFIRTRNKEYPRVEYKGHDCVVYAEEFLPYKSPDDFDAAFVSVNGRFKYLDDALRMNSEIAAAHFDFSALPSGYALFERFDPADMTDEVMENAGEWIKYARKLPACFAAQIDRIWERWNANRAYLQSRYDRLPTSIFQADINSSNILLDDDGNFVGVLDFNIAGKDTFINYLFREIPYVFENRKWVSNNETGAAGTKTAKTENEIALERIVYAIHAVKKHYRFSDAERELALPLYRCIRPLWYTNVRRLRDARSEEDIQRLLNETEHVQTEKIDFVNLMQ